MKRAISPVLCILAILTPQFSEAQMRDPGIKEPKLPGIDNQRPVRGLPGARLPRGRKFEDFNPVRGPLANCDLPYRDNQRVALPDEALGKAMGTAIGGIGSAQPRPAPAAMTVAPEAPATDRG